jgi:hypothetical protein
MLCSIRKIFENIMQDNFGHSLPSCFQCGFQRNNSNATAAITIQNNIARALDKKTEVIVVSTDMSAALNLVDKDVLLPQMAKICIPKNLIRIYNDFLSDRMCNGTNIHGQPIRSILVSTSNRWNILVLDRCQSSCLCR